MKGVSSASFVLLLLTATCSEPGPADRYLEGYVLEGGADVQRIGSYCVEFYWFGGEPAVMAGIREVRARKLTAMGGITLLSNCEAAKEIAVSACITRYRVAESWIRGMQAEANLPDGLEWPQRGGIISYQYFDDRHAGDPNACVHREPGVFEEEMQAFFVLLAPPPKK